MKIELRETVPHGGTISREEILARLEDRALVILNVMPGETFADGHIPGSINLPETRARQLVANFNQEIAVYCAGATCADESPPSIFRPRRSPAIAARVGRVVRASVAPARELRESFSRRAANDS